MFFGECGKKIKEGSKFCTGCGTKIEPISITSSSANKEEVIVKDNNALEEKEQEITKVENTEFNNNANVVTSNSTTSYNNQNVNYNVKVDKPSVLFNILAFFVPIVGLILFLTMKDETPKKAKSIGISALIGYIVSIVVSVIMFVFVYGVMLLNEDSDYVKPNNRNYNYYIERDYNI